MRAFSRTAAVVCQLVLLAAVVCSAQKCPPSGWDSVKDLDLKKYIAAPWYVQQQVPVTYQPLSTFYCVRARYVPVDPKDLKKGVVVMNYSNKDKVNGQGNGVSGAAGNTSFSLFAVPAPVAPGRTAASKLLVGPRFLLQAAPVPAVAQRLGSPKGNYWVVAAGPSKDPALGYDWAVITGGAQAPSLPGAAGSCGPSAARDEGLWLFHRQPVAPAADLERMRAAAKDLGIDLTRLKPVEQKGCKYVGADGLALPSSTAMPAAANTAAQQAGAAPRASPKLSQGLSTTKPTGWSVVNTASKPAPDMP